MPTTSPSGAAAACSGSSARTAPAPRAPPTVDGVLHKLGTSADATQKLAAALKGLGPEALAKLRAAKAAAQK